MPFPTTIDITRQQVSFDAVSGLDSKAWLQDVLFAVAIQQGYVNGVISDSEPPDIRKIWYRSSNPPSGLPGQPYSWDANAQDWLPLSPAQFIGYLSINQRSQPFRQATAPTPSQNPQVMDWWLSTVDDRMSILFPVVAGLNAWIDVSGAPIDSSAIAAVAQATLAAVLPSTLAAVVQAALAAVPPTTLVDGGTP